MERLARRLDCVAERLEQPPDDALAASCWQDRDGRLERRRLVGERLALLPPAPIAAPKCSAIALARNDEAT